LPALAERLKASRDGARAEKYECAVAVGERKHCFARFLINCDRPAVTQFHATEQQLIGIAID
jgi:hypothetical protein